MKPGPGQPLDKVGESKVELTSDEILRAWKEAIEHLAEAMNVIETDRLTILKLQAENRALSERLRALGDGRRSLIRPMCRADKL
jgi:hypothetical protein